MSAAEIISEIKKLPPHQRRRVFAAVEKLSQAEEDRIDNEIADRVLARADFMPWPEAKRKLGLA
ncbi:MAG: hypothetical protein ABIZ49_13520 [Opitutaceae bacterium]